MSTGNIFAPNHQTCSVCLPWCAKNLMGNFLRTFKPQAMLSQNPVVVVLGCTGTGKSKLAIELAKRFNGEIISADSMQVYKGLDIVTNKVTSEEQREVPHYCIDCVDPLSRYTVVDFRNQTLPIVNKLMQQKKLPIIVGGTNYYIESLLWEVLINKENEEAKLLFDAETTKVGNNFTLPSHCSSSTKELMAKEILPDSFKEVSSSDLHKCLLEIDPVMANTLHPEDRRKIIRSLQVFQQHGCLHSSLLQQQRTQNGGSSLGGPLRFKKAVMLWLQCDKEVLGKRLDDRVDEMLERGLIAELLDFHKSYNENRIDVQNPMYAEGIFQSIGFKEFHKYLVLTEEERSSDKGKTILKQAIKDMKIATRQYARKQGKWIVNRFLKKPDRQLPPVYGLPATDLNLWELNVTRPAIDIVGSLLQNLAPIQKPLPMQESLEDVPESHYCDICERVFVGRRVWEIHLKSKRHYRVKASKNKTSKKSEVEISNSKEKLCI